MQYEDIVPDYDQYLALQTETFRSFESEEPRWADPQREAIVEIFQPLLERLGPHVSILDAGCGDGTGLAALRELGFGNLLGVDICGPKAEQAIIRGQCPALKLDLHQVDLLAATGECFDIIYCSHALEHCYEPGKVLAGFHNILTEDGLLVLILPFPDNGVDQAHGGKYELGTDKDDGGKRFIALLREHGFGLIDYELGCHRGGPEGRFVFQRVAK